MKTSLLTTLFIFALLSLGTEQSCPLSLPQDVPWYSGCGPLRSLGLAVQKFDYNIQPPTESMPFARLRLGILQLTHILIKDPFLKSHADKWRILAAFNAVAKAGYMLKHALSPPIMTMAEFASISSEFKKAPKAILDGYVKTPSDTEAFQKEMTEWISDAWFAEQRLAGTNPMSLKRITFSDEIGSNWNELKPKLNDNFDWEGTVSRALKGMSLKKAIDEGYLYVLYHPMSDDLKTVEDDGDNDADRKMWKFLSPIAVFVSSEGKLVPIAIQMDHTPESQVYTPKDGGLWTLAKLNVQVTDLETSQIVEHLSKVHLVSEGLCIVVQRELSDQHPLFVIMRFHCRGVLTLNTYGGPVLLAKDNQLDQLFPYGHEGSNALVGKTAKIIEWNDIKLENNIKRRGVDDSNRLPYYPFRDDGAEIDKSIKSMITAYVHAYYSSDADVTRDRELQNYAQEVSDKGKYSKVKLRGFPASIDTKEQLVETFSRMIWLMTGQHVSVNYPMADYVNYIPSTPLKLYDSKRVPNTTFGPERLPNRAQTAGQASFATTLASFRQDRLFDYADHLTDAKGKEVVSRHYRHLNEVVAPLLDKRNQERLKAGHLTYPYMMPRWVPNGIQS